MPEQENLDDFYKFTKNIFQSVKIPAASLG